MGGGWSAEGPTPESTKKDHAGLLAALDAGINFFDHADIYGRGGKSEEAFADLWELRPGIRDKIIIQSKCGIRSGFFDFSYEHIVGSAEASLKRLKTDYLDVYLLHRPDTLVEYEEVAKAFDKLQSSGKVRYFGVSNHTAGQIEVLQKHLSQPLVTNQIQFSMVHAGIIDEGIYFNRKETIGMQQSGGLLEYSRLNDITLQAYNSIAGGSFTGENAREEYKPLAALISKMAQEKGVSDETIVFAWVLRHPAKIQPVIGTRTPERIRAATEATKVELTRQEWYSLYYGVGKKQP